MGLNIYRVLAVYTEVFPYFHLNNNKNKCFRIALICVWEYKCKLEFSFRQCGMIVWQRRYNILSHPLHLINKKTRN